MLIGKAKLYNFENSEEGIKQLVTQLHDLNKQDKLSFVVLESSGGYERDLVTMCNKNNIPVHVAHADKVRSFAKSKGILAKTDKLDATVLSEYGSIMRVESDKLLLTKNSEKIRLLLDCHKQLMNDCQREKNCLDKIRDKNIKNSTKSHFDWLSDLIFQPIIY
jgi:transposase